MRHGRDAEYGTSRRRPGGEEGAESGRAHNPKGGLVDQATWRDGRKGGERTRGRKQAQDGTRGQRRTGRALWLPETEKCLEGVKAGVVSQNRARGEGRTLQPWPSCSAKLSGRSPTAPAPPAQFRVLVFSCWSPWGCGRLPTSRQHSSFQAGRKRMGQTPQIRACASF